MNTKQQGDIGVSQAVAYYVSHGRVVCYPLTDNARYDLIIEKDSLIKRVQCKTTNYKRHNDTYEVQLKTSGGNQSWTHQSKKISKQECDILFVFSFDGKIYEFPPEVFDGKSQISLGKKYQQYILDGWQSG